MILLFSEDKNIHISVLLKKREIPEREIHEINIAFVEKREKKNYLHRSQKDKEKFLSFILDRNLHILQLQIGVFL